MVTHLLTIMKQERSVLLYIFSNAAVGFYNMGIATVVFNLYLLALGFDIAFIGILNATGMIVWTVASLPASWIGVRFGLRGSVIFGYFMIAFFFAIFLSMPWFPRPVWEAGLLSSIGLIYFGASLITVNGSPYLMAVCPQKDRNTAFALLTAIMTLFAFLGALVAGFLPGFLMRQAAAMISAASAYNAVLWLGVLAFFVSGLLMLKARPAPALVHEIQTATRESAPISLLIFLVVLFTLQLSSENTMLMFLNVYLANDLMVSTGLIGIIIAFSRLLPFFLSPLQPLVLKRWGSGWTMNAGYGLVGVGLVVMAFFPAWEVAASAFIILSLITSFTATARNLYGQEAVLPRWRTAVGAVSTISMAVASGIVGFGANRIIISAGFRGLFLSGAVLALLVVMLYSQRALLNRRNHAQTAAVHSPASK